MGFYVTVELTPRAINVEDGKINCNLSYFCVYTLVIDTYPKVVFLFQDQTSFSY